MGKKREELLELGVSDSTAAGDAADDADEVDVVVVVVAEDVEVGWALDKEGVLELELKELGLGFRADKICLTAGDKESNVSLSSGAKGSRTTSRCWLAAEGTLADATTGVLVLEGAA